MQSLLQSIIQDPTWVGILVDSSLLIVAFLFPTSATALLSIRHFIKSKREGQKVQAIQDLLPLLNSLPIANKQIQQLAQEMGQDRLSQLLEHYAPGS